MFYAPQTLNLSSPEYQVRTVNDRNTLERVAPAPQLRTEEYATDSVAPAVTAALGWFRALDRGYALSSASVVFSVQIV